MKHLTRRRFGALAAGVGLAAIAGGKKRAAAGEASTGERFEIELSEDEWRKRLTPEQFHILRQHGTERPFSSPLDKLFADGTYHCAGCDLPLFSSATKYDSRTGWPSFYKPLERAIGTRIDRTLWMVRIEVHCRRCGGHLGHVFNDGPRPTGQRYCINGLALKFVPKSAAEPPAPAQGPPPPASGSNERPAAVSEPDKS